MLGALQIASYVKKSHRALNQDLKLANKRTRLFVGGAATGGDAGSPGGRLLTPTTRPPARPFALSGLRARDICSRGYFAYISRETAAHRRTQHHGVSRQMYFWASADLLFTRATLKTQRQYLTPVKAELTDRHLAFSYFAFQFKFQIGNGVFLLAVSYNWL